MQTFFVLRPRSFLIIILNVWLQYLNLFEHNTYKVTFSLEGFALI